MHVEFTIRGRDGDLGDVLVAAPADTALCRVTERLAGLGLPTGGDRLWSDGRELTDADTVDALRTGGVLTVGVRPDRAPAAALSLDVVGGPAAGHSHELATGRLTIGRSPACDVCLDDADISRWHAVLDVGRSAVTISDAGSTNGTRVDGSLIAAPAALESGRLMRVGDSFLSVRGAEHTPAITRTVDSARVLNRAPRPSVAALAGEVVLPVRPVRPAPHRVQILAALLPAAAGAGFAWALHAPQFLFFALLSPVMLLATSLGDRMHWRRSRRREAAAHRAQLGVASRAIAAGLDTETVQRRLAHPDPVSLAEIAALPGSRLWERRRVDADHLDVRLGLGDLAAELLVRDGTASRPAGMCRAVPVVASLRHGTLGVTGPPAPAHALGRWLLGQLCVLHSPADVEVVVLTSDERRWHWARWLPHLRMHAVGRSGWADTAAELVTLADERRRVRARSALPWQGPWLVVIADATGECAEVPGLAQLIAAGADVGITGVWLATRREALPSGCGVVAEVHGETGSRVRVSSADGAVHEAVLDQVQEPWADGVARALAPFVDGDADAAAAVPAQCRLLDLLGDDGGTDAIQQRWARSDGGAGTVVGIDADGPTVLDLVRDGPHALIAGTTGSGKSELLQTLIAGLAANHPPDRLGFLLVDYKGGAAFAECARLPHTAGLVTDLDAHLTRRALRSLDAEILRRERLFAAAGAVDLAGYAATAPREPISRLVIVVDEFATLVEELPDFVRGLVGVAQRGRSLGLHLVLATQRPSGVVSADIRANTELRIALRVADAGESSDIIGTADAAAISRRTPGRALLGSAASPRAFQTARIGGPAAPTGDDLAVERLGPWRSRSLVDTTEGPTDLALLVDRIRAACSESGVGSARRPWQEPLPDLIAAEALEADLLDGTAPASLVPIGVLDLPAEQRQERYVVDLDIPSATLIAGGPRSGRSSAVVTFAVQAAGRLGPQDLHVHVVDAAGAAGALRALPHCGTYAGPDGAATVGRLVERLCGLAEERRRLLAEHGWPDVAASRRAGRAMPAVLLIVDGWELFAAAADERDAGRTSDALLGLARNGASVGLLVVVTGDRGLLSPRVSAAFAERLLLRMSDRADFGMAGVAARDVPERMPPGRAVRARDGLEIQLAFAGSAPTRPEQDRVVAEIAARHPRGAPDAIRIRPLPPDVALPDLERVAQRWVLGLGDDEAAPITLDPGAGIRLLVAGPPRSGRTTFLRTLLAQTFGREVAVAAPVRSRLRADAEAAGVRVLAPTDGLPEGFGDGARSTVLLVDDVDHLGDDVLAEEVLALVRAGRPGLTVVVAGRNDELATTYRGLGAELRRNRCGLLLQPGPVDGDIIGIRLPRHREQLPPGRGVLVGEPGWGPELGEGRPIPIQLARP